MQVFLDPELCVLDSLPPEWANDNLYEPVRVLKDLPGEGQLVVQFTPSLYEGEKKRPDCGEIEFRMSRNGVREVKEEHKKGVSDILNLTDFSEMSLLHTYVVDACRVRSLNPVNGDTDSCEKFACYQY